MVLPFVSELLADLEHSEAFERVRRPLSGDTSAPRASAQVAAYTLECFRVLQVCEELADKG